MIFIIAWFGATAAPAHAISPGAIEDAVRALPAVRGVTIQVPRVALTAAEDAQYGLHEAAVIQQLNAAKSQTVETVDSAAAAVAGPSGSSELQDAAKGCAKNGLKKAASDYFSAEANQTSYPIFNSVFFYAVQGCIAQTIPNFPSDASRAIAGYLTRRVSQPVFSARQAEPAAFASWLSATSEEVGTEPQPEPDPEIDTTTTTTDFGGDTGGSSGGGGSSFPWGLVVVGLVGMAAIGYFFNRKS